MGNKSRNQIKWIGTECIEIYAGKGTYVIRVGETLTSVSHKNGTECTVNQLISVNGAEPMIALKSGKTIRMSRLSSVLSNYAPNYKPYVRVKPRPPAPVAAVFPQKPFASAPDEFDHAERHAAIHLRMLNMQETLEKRADKNTEALRNLESKIDQLVAAWCPAERTG